ncbi:MAG: DUF2807 domain-containing protein [Chitinophagaceae bacterium]|nr:DUF2807 domain-containing protein [Chitinophagaceae bacterium]
MKNASLSITMIVVSILSISVFQRCSFVAKCVKGSGNQVIENRTPGTFTSVRTSGPMKIILSQAAGNEVRIQADDNIQDLIKMTLSGSRLTIDMEDNSCDPGPITVYLSAAKLEALSCSGPSEVTGEGTITVKDFNLELSGDGKVNLSLDVQYLQADFSGSSAVVLKGNAQKLSIHSSGSGHIVMNDFTAKQCKLETSGGSKVDLDLETESLEASASGSSDFAFQGSAKSLRINTSGSGSVEAGDFKVDECFIETSGNSNIRVNVVDELTINSSGSSDVEYKGNPRVTNKQSGASSVKKIE